MPRSWHGMYKFLCEYVLLRISYEEFVGPARDEFL